jgi:hypothetical protein
VRVLVPVRLQPSNPGNGNIKDPELPEDPLVLGAEPDRVGHPFLFSGMPKIHNSWTGKYFRFTVRSFTIQGTGLFAVFCIQEFFTMDFVKSQKKYKDAKETFSTLFMSIMDIQPRCLTYEVYQK